MSYHPFRHAGLKVVSLGLAVLLWMTVAREPTVERNLRIPLHFQNLSSELQIVGEPPTGVDVRVRGSSGQLGRLQPGDIVAILDLSSARPGTRMFNLFTDHVQGPLGVTVDQVISATVSLEFERIGARHVPIVPAIEGEPARGYMIDRVMTEPPSVEILGPESRLHEVLEATTEAVSVRGATATVRDVVTVGIPDSALRLRQAQTAAVTVEVVEGPASLDLPGLPVHARNLGPDADPTIVFGVVSVRVQGSVARIDELSPEQLSAFVDAAGLSSGDHQVPVQIEAPPGITVEHVEPSDIRLRIK